MANDERLTRSNVACRMRIDRVLIHCKMGIGRSPTLAAAYLVWTGTSIDEAIRKVEGTKLFYGPVVSQFTLSKFAASLEKNKGTA
jgi:protein-tyrosine phosphatase